VTAFSPAFDPRTRYNELQIVTAHNNLNQCAHSVRRTKRSLRLLVGSMVVRWQLPLPPTNGPKRLLFLKSDQNLKVDAREKWNTVFHESNE
jgi:hypothetical protein